MPTPVPGIHHVTAVARDPATVHRFYSQTLGLRLVKQSINQDDVSVYHLFYGDRTGSPGTSMTFFPYPDVSPGRVGTGQVTTTQFTIPRGSVSFWEERLADHGVDRERFERFGEDVLAFTDPDGLPLELVATHDAPAGDPPDGPVPKDLAIRGFYAATLSVVSAAPTTDLVEAMGYTATERTRHRTRYEADGDLGRVLDVLERPQAVRGVPGSGTVHHVAFRVADDELEAWRDVIAEHGLRPTAVIDRKWFRSIYARTRSGVLFEWATPSPGYTVDEDVDKLGERLMLPSWLEDRRSEIEANLPALDPSDTADDR